jgi:hypothetical protein
MATLTRDTSNNLEFKETMADGDRVFTKHADGTLCWAIPSGGGGNVYNYSTLQTLSGFNSDKNMGISGDGNTIVNVNSSNYPEIYKRGSNGLFTLTQTINIAIGTQAATLVNYDGTVAILKQSSGTVARMLRYNSTTGIYDFIALSNWPMTTNSRTAFKMNRTGDVVVSYYYQSSSSAYIYIYKINIQAGTFTYKNYTDTNGYYSICIGRTAETEHTVITNTYIYDVQAETRTSITTGLGNVRTVANEDLTFFYNLNGGFTRNGTTFSSGKKLFQYSPINALQPNILFANANKAFLFSDAMFMTDAVGSDNINTASLVSFNGVCPSSSNLLFDASYDYKTAIGFNTSFGTLYVWTLD